MKATNKYSDYDVKNIQKEIVRKREFYYDRNPDEAKALPKIFCSNGSEGNWIKNKISENFKQMLYKRRVLQP